MTPGRVLTMGFAVLLMMAMPLVTLAQTGGAPATPGAPGTPTTPGAPNTSTTPGAPTTSSPGLSTPPGTATTPAPAVPGTNRGTGLSGPTGGQAAPRMPATQSDCSSGGWQRFGFTDQTACLGALPAGSR